MNSLRGIIWVALGKPLFLCTPHNAYLYRRLILRLFGMKCGRNVRIRRSVKIDNPWNLTVGDLVIFGDGAITRDFIHVDDVVDAIILSTSHSKNSIYNIASGTSTSISNLAETMIAISGKDIEIIYQPSRSGDIMFSATDISLAKETLKFMPKISLKSGLEEFMSK